MITDGDQMTFLKSLKSDLKILQERLGVTTLEFSPREGSFLYFKNHDDFPANVKIACDNAMSVLVLGLHEWQPEETKFTEWVLSSSNPITLIDVGANMGLFTRQVLTRLRTIDYSFVYEPHPGNFDLLSFNLTPFEKIERVNAALSDKDGKLELFLDPENCGNYSLTKAAMPAKFSTTTVEIRDAFRESQRWLARSNLVFYKSDTQGFDELIATQLDMLFWESVVGGIMELWQIDKPAYDAAKLEEILDSFPNKVLLNDPARQLSTADILQYLRSRERGHFDLGFWR